MRDKIIEKIIDLTFPTASVLFMNHLGHDHKKTFTLGPKWSRDQKDRCYWKFGNNFFLFFHCYFFWLCIAFAQQMNVFA